MKNPLSLLLALGLVRWNDDKRRRINLPVGLRCREAPASQGGFFLLNARNTEGRCRLLRLAGEESRIIGDPQKDREHLIAISPALQAHKIRVPLFLAYGEKDTLIPPEHSRRLAEAMRRNGQEAELHIFPNEAHGFEQPENERRLYQDLVRFLRRNMPPQGQN